VSRYAKDWERIQSFSAKEADAFATALSPLIQPSIIYDAAATDAARKQAAEKIKPITISLKTQSEDRR
jgi:membrane-associated HD superfamily phosphohydrolase